MSRTDGGTGGWSNPYVAEYESIIAQVEELSASYITALNSSVDTAISDELGIAQNYVPISAPSNWVSQVVNPVNSISQQINTTFNETFMQRVSQLQQCKVTQTYSFKS